MSDEGPELPDASDPPDDGDGKHLILKVPHYEVAPAREPNLTATPTQYPLTYLRLGAYAKDPTAEPGSDLVDLVAQTGPLANNLANNSGDGSFPGAQTFDDDVRDRTGSTNHGLAPAARASDTAVLTSRGGWRDHTDGNRITTTRGDKVEVIRGNYKMVILGRSDDPQGAVGWDASNQNLLDYGGGAVPGSTTEVKFNPDLYGGIWEQIAQSIGAISYTTTVGDAYEWTYGDHIESTTGSETPGADGEVPTGTTPSKTQPGVASPGPNPIIVEKTWAKSISSYTGSAAMPVPLMLDETFALEMTSVTNAVNIAESTTAAAVTSATTVAGTISDVTTAGMITEVTNAGAVNSATTVAGAITEVVTAGAINSVTTAALALNEMTNATAITSVTTAGVITDISLPGAELDVKVAGVLQEVTVAGTIESAQLAILVVEFVAALKVAISLSAELNVFIGGKFDVNLSAAAEINLIKWDLSAEEDVTSGLLTLS